MRSPKLLALMLFMLAVLTPVAWASDRTPKPPRHVISTPKPPTHAPKNDEQEPENGRKTEERHEIRPPIHPPVPMPSPPFSPPVTPPQKPAPHPHGQEHGEEYDEEFTYYGQVQAVMPKVVVGSRTLIGSQELLQYLAPGMQVEVEGQVINGHLHVKEIHVLEPKGWAYFEGPNPGIGWSRVWYLNGKVWKTQTIDPGPRVRLLACYQGSWIGLPPSLTPALTPPEEGLWLLEGLIWKNTIRWTKRQKVGECEG